MRSGKPMWSPASKQNKSSLNLFMKGLVSMRYRFLRFPGGKAKAVTFSYDDGTVEDIRLAETLDKYGQKCTFNINSGMFGKGGEGRLSAAEIEQHLLSGGHEIAVHGLMHRAPGAQRSIEGIRDVLDCRLGLEKAFGMIIRGMAYPDSGIRNMQNGASYENIRQYLKDLDITYARTLGGDNNLFRLPDDWYAWMPTAHHDNPKVLEWADQFVEMDIESMYSVSPDPISYSVPSRSNQTVIKVGLYTLVPSALKTSESYAST